jgi:hypothetical protein
MHTVSHMRARLARAISRLAAKRRRWSEPATAPSSPTRIEKLRAGLDVARMRGVEIAPLSRASVKKSEGDITYVDRLTHDELLEAHKGASYVDPKDILPVDIVLGEKSIAEAAADVPKFDYAVASHVVEHVADLISWFADVAKILKPDGTFRLAVPDRRFTFDYLRQETKTSELINAYAQKAMSPTSQCIADHYLNVRKVDFRAAWDGTIDGNALESFHSPSYAIGAANETIKIENLPDIHCWVFTPKSFAMLMYDLAKLDMMDFACVRLFDTEPYTFEFFVVMQKCADKTQILDSWGKAIKSVASRDNHKR